MTAYTQSGYPVIGSYGDPLIEPLVVSGVSIAPGVRSGDVHTILGWVAARFDATVAPLKGGQCWGYDKREIRGGSGWSNHAGGCAIDCDSLDFPQGSTRMSRAQKKACKAIVKACRGVVRWGGSYHWPTKKDQQHFEIGNNMANTPALRQLAADIRAGKLGGSVVQPVSKPTITKVGLTVDRAQTLLNRTGVARLDVDGIYGPQTAQAVERFQRHQDLPVTGTIDDATWERLKDYSTKYGWEPPSARDQALARLHELQQSAGISDAAQRHLETAYQNVAKADRDPALKEALARYRELLGKVDLSPEAFQHLRTAAKNVEKASKK